MYESKRKLVKLIISFLKNKRRRWASELKHFYTFYSTPVAPSSTPVIAGETVASHEWMGRSRAPSHWHTLSLVTINKRARSAGFVLLLFCSPITVDGIRLKVVPTGELQECARWHSVGWNQTMGKEKCVSLTLHSEFGAVRLPRRHFY